MATKFNQDQEFSCRDRVGQGEENLCFDKLFCVMTEFGLDRGF